HEVQRVPQELLEEIFSYASEGKANLTSYSLVCRAWTWPTRPYLFRVLNIDTIIRRGTQRDADKQTTSAMSSAYFAKSTAQSIARFIAFLEAHPPIALLYQRFLIGSRPWVDPVNSVVDDTIAQCLELTRNIRDLDAITTDAPYSKALQKAVVRKLRSSVTILSMVQDMVGMPLVAAAIREAPHLRELRVTVRDRLTPIVRAQESAADPTDHAHTRPVLRALVVGKATHDLPPWLVSANCPAALSALRELTIHESTLHVASVHAPLLAAVGATLRALTLVSWDLDFSVDFGALPALRRLRVCGMSLRAVSAGRAALVFKQLPRAPAPQLEHVELVFTPVRAMDERMKPVRAWQDFGEL
ncbi:hypothetical protein HDZ31DRAFT_23143, partial [Schizophyllum fasciatum]